MEVVKLTKYVQRNSSRRYITRKTMCFLNFTETLWQIRSEQDNMLYRPNDRREWRGYRMGDMSEIDVLELSILYRQRATPKFDNTTNYYDYELRR